MTKYKDLHEKAYGVELEEALYYIETRLRWYGRIFARDTSGGLQVRFGCVTLADLLFPGRWKIPHWAWRRVLPVGVGLWIARYQRVIYREVYRSALRRWPGLREHLLVYSQYPEVLRPLDSRLQILYPIQGGQRLRVVAYLDGECTP